MKFRRSDVENLDLTGARSEDETGVIDLSAGTGSDSETLTDDLIFDEGDDLDLTGPDAGMATAEISTQDTFVDEGVGLSTEPLGVDASEMTEVVGLDEIDEDDDDGAPRQRETIRTGPPRRTAAAEEPSDIGWSLLMTVEAIVMLLAFFVLLGIRDINVGDGKAPEFALNIAGTFYEVPK